MFAKVLARFLRHSPVAVLGSLAVQRALDPTWLDEVFHQHRDRTYEKELLFSSVVDLTSHVVLGLQPSLHAAFKRDPLEASFQAFYGKVHRTEARVLRAMVAGSYRRLAPVVGALGAPRAPLVPGHRIRILDGNELAPTEKRLKLLRHFRGAALPGQSLVVYDHDLDLVVDALPCEDAHQNERALMPQLLESVRPGDIHVADRNFSTRPIFRSYRQRQAYLVVREHGAQPNPTEMGRRRYVGRVETGRVYVQRVEIPADKSDDKPMRLRRIEIHLDEPTQDGDTVVRLLTNVP
ncbi:MAG: IS4 family transposase, partial [Myxococcaceae bacterium]